jgi:DNA-directed RNA polymerase specialized sigma24 family protein
VGFSRFWAQDAPLADLVAAAQADPNSDSTVMNEIVSRFELKAQRLARDLTTDIHLQQDIANAARYAVVVAVRAHDLTVPGFTAYVVRTMRGEARRAFGNAICQDEVAVADDAELWTKPTTPQPSLVVESDLALLAVNLSVEQRVLVFARYVEDAQLAQVAAEVGTSVSALSHRFKTIHQAIRS